MQVLCISLPWRNLRLPAAALGSLPPWLRQHGIPAEACHLYLDIAAAYGLADYERLDDRLHHQDFAQEATYAGLLWPERRATVQDLLAGVDAVPWPDDFWDRWQSAHDRAFARIDWQEWPVVVICGNGVISSPDSHYLAGIEAARRIKAASPATSVILAGPDFIGEIGQSLMETVPWVDLVVNGEPESALLAACQALEAGRPITAPGILQRREDGTVNLSRAPQLPDLDVLPLPDYDAYVQHPVARELGRRLLPLEGARGCWWDRSHRDVRASCQFCSINVAWQGYRSKSVARITAEVRHLVDRYGSHDLEVLDSITRPQDTAELYGTLADAVPGLTLHRVEAYANLDRATLWQMKRAGVCSIQLGVEALVPSLLARMHKGISFARIVETLRDCAELGIAVTANVILGWPGSTADEVAETLRRLQSLTWLPPLRAFGLMVGHGSPLARQAGDTIGNAAAYRTLLPEAWAARLVLAHREIPDAAPAADWGAVHSFVRHWQERWQASDWAYRSFYIDQPPGRPGVLVLIRCDAEGKATVLTLQGTDRRLWLMCRQSQTPQTLQTVFDTLAPEDIGQRLASWTAAGMMLEADGRYLSIGVAGPPALLARLPLNRPDAAVSPPVRLTLRPNGPRPQA